MDARRERAEHRDTQALQAKLDELLRVHGAARNELTTLDKEEPEEIERHRKQDASDSQHERNAPTDKFE
jgi:low affinity Fe/Cu permease